MYDVVLLTLDDAPGGGCTSGSPRVPVLQCKDALVAADAKVETVTAYADEDIDAVLERCGPDGPARLVVAAISDGQVRAVVRRMTRRYAPTPSERPASLADDRTIPDLPPIGILPMGDVSLVASLGLPADPASVAAAVLGDGVRRLDLLRNDGGSVTLQGALLGGTDEEGQAVPFAATVNVDDTVLADGTERLVAVAVANGPGYASVDPLPLAPGADPADGVLDVAVAVPVRHRRLFRRSELRIEVRRARGRAVAVSPQADVRFVDDGVAGTLGRKRTW